MTRESKTLLLLSLTYLLYATSIFLSQGTFIFPFPLNGFALFVITLQLAWWHKNEPPYAFTVTLIGLSSLIASPPFWEIWLSNESLLHLEEINFYSIVYLIHLMLIIVYLFISLMQFKDAMLITISLIATTGIIIGFLLASYLVLSLSFLLIFSALVLKGKVTGLNWIWAFLLFFNVIDFISFGI